MPKSFCGKQIAVFLCAENQKEHVDGGADQNAAERWNSGGKNGQAEASAFFFYCQQSR